MSCKNIGANNVRKFDSLEISDDRASCFLVMSISVRAILRRICTTSRVGGFVNGLDTSKADRVCNEAVLEVPRRGRAGVTSGIEAALGKRQRNILVYSDFVETGGRPDCVSNALSLFRFMQGIEGQITY